MQNMMGPFWGWGMMTFFWIFQVLLVIIMILVIAWLNKQIRK